MRLDRRLVELAGRLRLPRRSVRLRLTLLYSVLFLVSGAALLGFTYLLVSHGGGATVGAVKQQAFGSITGSGGGAALGGGTAVQVPGGGIIVIPGGLSPKQIQGQISQLHVVARSVRGSDLHLFLFWSLIALAVMAVASIGLGWLVSGRILRRLSTVTATARSISASNLHERLAFEGPNDELKELGDTFDGLLARLEAAFEAQRRFVANASHELRTPLARQRTVAQVALADPEATIDSLRQAHERALAAGAEQQRLLDALLTLAKGQAGLQRREPFDLAPLTEEVLLACEGEAQERGLEVHTNLASAPATGDPRLVDRLVANLVDNALRHNVEGGRVDASTETQAGGAVLSLANTGPVVAPDEVERLFEPFRRAGADRTGGQGHGLGLSIVRAIADAHGATVTAEPQTEGGLRVEVVFPSPEEPAE